MLDKSSPLYWEEPPYYEAVSLAEGAMRYHVSQATLRTWVKNGKVRRAKIEQERQVPSGKPYTVTIEGVHAPYWVSDYERVKEASEDALFSCTQHLRFYFGVVARRFELISYQAGWKFLLRLSTDESSENFIRAKHLRGAKEAVIDFDKRFFGMQGASQLQHISLMLIGCYFEPFRSRLELNSGDLDSTFQSLGLLESQLAILIVKDVPLPSAVQWPDFLELDNFYKQVELDASSLKTLLPGP